jgi:hypothetical protein
MTLIFTKREILLGQEMVRFYHDPDDVRTSHPKLERENIDGNDLILRATS